MNTVKGAPPPHSTVNLTPCPPHPPLSRRSRDDFGPSAQRTAWRTSQPEGFQKCSEQALPSPRERKAISFCRCRQNRQAFSHLPLKQPQSTSSRHPRCPPDPRSWESTGSRGRAPEAEGRCPDLPAPLRKRASGISQPQHTPQAADRTLFRDTPGLQFSRRRALGHTGPETGYFSTLHRS